MFNQKKFYDTGATSLHLFLFKNTHTHKHTLNKFQFKKKKKGGRRCGAGTSPNCLLKTLDTSGIARHMSAYCTHVKSLEFHATRAHIAHKFRDCVLNRPKQTRVHPQEPLASTASRIKPHNSRVYFSETTTQCICKP